MRAEVMMMEQLGQLSVSDAFALLRKGVAVYIASAPEAEEVFPLRGGWKDGEGDIRFDRVSFYLSQDTALRVARAFGQDCIIGLYPNAFGNGRVYLLKDLIRHRVFALRYAGNYVSDGEHLLIACLGNELPFEAEVLGSIPTDLVLTFPVHTHTHTRTRSHTLAPAPAGEGEGGRGVRMGALFRLITLKTRSHTGEKVV
jgi:hypothetical protein